MRLNELAKNDSHHLLGALCMPVPTSNTVRVLQFDEPVVEFEGEATECFALMLASRRRAVA